MSHFLRLHFSSGKLTLNCGCEPSELPQIYIMKLGRPALMKFQSNAWEVKSHSVSSCGNNTSRPQDSALFMSVAHLLLLRLFESASL